MRRHISTSIAAVLLGMTCVSQAGGISYREWSPPDAAVYIVSEQAIINGLPTSIFKFSSERPPAEIAAFYKDKFGEKALDQKLGRHQTIASMLDQKFYTVQIRQRLSGGVEGTVSVADVSSKAQAPKLPDGLQLPMGSHMLFSSKSPDMGRMAEMYVYGTRLSLQETRNMLVASLQRVGYIQDNKPMGDLPKSSAVLFHAANGKEVITTINRNSSGLTLVVMNFVFGPSNDRR
jgi:hypothetical protein